MSFEFPESRTSDDPCDQFASIVNQVLDQELDAEALECVHTVTCPQCQQLGTQTKILLRGLTAVASEPVASAEFTNRLVSAAIKQHRAIRLRRYVHTAAIVASFLLVSLISVGFLAPQNNVQAPTRNLPEQQPIVNTPPDSTPTPIAQPGVYEQVSEAEQAVVSLSRKAKDQTLIPTRNLIPPSETISLPRSTGLPGVEPAADSIAGMPDAARSGFEPMADKTKRAVNLFLRDFGVSPSGKPN